MDISVKQMNDSLVNEVFQRFNALQGRLRISVTHACQLRCRFCHQEGIDQHWQPTHIDKRFLTSLVNTYVGLGGRYIELTGGEPTIHPRIGELIDAVAGFNRDIILCTNGLRLDRIQEQIEREKVNLIRLSLHATDSDDISRHLLGNAWDFAKLKLNIEHALASNAQFQLIFTHTRQNSHYLESVLNHALLWDVDLQIVDLISSRVKHPAIELGYVGGDESETIVRKHAELEAEVHDRTGSVLRVYRTPTGKRWEIKDYHFGVLHTEMCSGCTKRTECGEGVYALRVDASGVIKPCLLREDLQHQVSTERPELLDIALTSMLNKMLSGRLLWN